MRIIEVIENVAGNIERFELDPQEYDALNSIAELSKFYLKAVQDMKHISDYLPGEKMRALDAATSALEKAQSKLNQTRGVKNVGIPTPKKNLAT
jgi:hypothetical protein